MLESSSEHPFSQEVRYSAKLSLQQMVKEEHLDVCPLNCYQRWKDSTLLHPLSQIIKSNFLFQ